MKHNFYSRAFIFLAMMGTLVAWTAGVASANELMEKTVGGLSVGQPVVHEGLAVFPLSSKVNRNVLIDSFLTLDEALERKYLVINELDGGRVPEVSIENRSKNTVFIMGGEIITGCKQDRIIGKDIVLGPGMTMVKIPVFCVEAGRWTFESQNFYSKKNAGTYKLRGYAQEKNSESQSKIWNEISKMNDSMKVSSDSNAFQAAYEDKEVRKRLERYEAELLRIPDQYPDSVGAVVCIGKQVVSVDVFSSPLHFRKLWPKLVRASGLVAVAANDKEISDRAAVEKFLSGIVHLAYASENGAGIGTNLNALDDAFNVQGIELKNLIVHFAAFPRIKEEVSKSERIQRHDRMNARINQTNNFINSINEE